MFDKKLISKLVSLAITGLFITLFIFLLPAILIFLGVVVLLLIIAAMVARYMIRKKKIQMHFDFEGPGSTTQDAGVGRGAEKIHEMKDVTNSIKSKS